jgi:hypothetical protein
VHPAVLNRRVRELGLTAFTTLMAVALGLGISIEIAKPSLAALIAIACAGAGLVFLLVNKRLEVSVVMVALYLGLLEGPVKLGSGAGRTGSALRDVLIAAVALGALIRLSKSREKVSMPPMAGWVFAWAGLVLAEAFNPKTGGISKALGGFRQQLEWLPFFFFAYALVRSKRRFRQMFILLGVVAFANGIVGTYQTRLSPGQLASWGPGYRELVYGTETEEGVKKGTKGRVFVSEGVAHVRPPALGTDAGFGGGVATIALAPLLALLIVGGLRKKWPIFVLLLGALASVATGLGRLQVVGSVLALMFFVGLSFSLGGRLTRSLAVLLGVLVLVIPVGAVFVSALGGSTFARYASIAPENIGSGTKDTKKSDLNQIPSLVERIPFGAGLGRVGAAAGFGGAVHEEVLEKKGFASDTAYTFELAELGLPGLILWVSLTITLLFLMLSRLRRIRDTEIRIYLTALTATLIAFTLIGFSGPTMESGALGPFFWATAGIAAYWFLGPGWKEQTRPRPGKPRTLAEPLPSAGPA